jgi:competence protein ComEA
LPGVGPSRAEAIVSYRKSHPFKRVDELTRIKGIGRKSLVRLRALLTTSGPTTLKERPAKASAGSPLAHGPTGSRPLTS